MTESELTRKIIEHLNSHPSIMVWRNNVGKRGNIAFGVKGSCDISGVVDGGYRVEIEVKLPGNNNFSEEQIPFMEQMKQKGALCGVAHSIEEAWDIIESVLPLIRLSK